MYPSNGVQRVLNPTLANAIVTKFLYSQKYQKEIKIENESGILSNIVGVDLTYELEIEVVAKASFTAPAPLTSLSFTAPSTGWVYPFAAAGASFNVLVMGDVKELGNPGEEQKFSFTGMINAVIP